MRRLLVHVLLPILALAGVWGLAGSAASETGSCADPPGDVHSSDDPEGAPIAGKLDIVQMDHSDTDSEVSYTLTTAEGFAAADVTEIAWFIDADGDFDGANRQFEGRVRVQAKEGGALAGSVMKGKQKLAAAPVTHEDGTTELTVEVPRTALRKLEVRRTYEYYVRTLEAGADPTERDFTEACEHAITSGRSPSPSSSPSSSPKAPRASGPRGAPSLADVDLESDEIAPGGKIIGSAEGFEKDSEATVSVESDSETLGKVDADDEGVVNFSFGLPSSVKEGDHEVKVRGTNPAGGTHLASADFSVIATDTATQGADKTATETVTQAANKTATETATQAKSGSGTLPRNGAGIQRNVNVALLLIGVGLALMAFTVLWRKRGTRTL